MTKALCVQDLSITTARNLSIVESVSFSVETGRVVGILGETGAGKTVTARAALGMLPRGLRARGQIRLGGGDWADAADSKALTQHLGGYSGLMLQNPAGSFDPLQKIGSQMIESVVRNRIMSKRVALARAGSLLDQLGLPDADSIFAKYPHQLSGGMSQRVALALTLMPRPQLLVVDEPTSALDANLRIEALRLLRSLVLDSGTSVVLISHDLGLVSRFCDEIVVMYAGRVVEAGPTEAVLSHSAHPYTRSLTACTVRFDRSSRSVLPTIGGEPPLPGEWPTGCHFHPRCPEVLDICSGRLPVFEECSGPDHGAACHRIRQEVH
ncbi:ABC transporter ATP-binding protein [Amycolatopsis sp. GM8]|uniref:ABC transporter ATP-binding protein n=1 Tax=Amycolatopsis sp. GM8 TaxID=2896530 RepID=UPI001F21E8F8|nr:ABC transporter ATP-binding protein [Amycolatopsis sp. GM8]